MTAERGAGAGDDHHQGIDTGILKHYYKYWFRTELFTEHFVCCSKMLFLKLVPITNNFVLYWIEPNIRLRIRIFCECRLSPVTPFSPFCITPNEHINNQPWNATKTQPYNYIIPHADTPDAARTARGHPKRMVAATVAVTPTKPAAKVEIAAKSSRTFRSISRRKMEPANQRPSGCSRMGWSWTRDLRCSSAQSWLMTYCLIDNGRALHSSYWLFTANNN